MNIAEVFVYPIKSLHGSAVDEALVCGYGLEHDRQWMLIDGESKMITQRECPRVATLHPHVEDGRLRIALPGGGEIIVPFSTDAWTDQQVTIDVWGHVYVGVVAAAPTNAALSQAVGAQCRLAYIRSDVFRAQHEVAFHDDSPLLIISQSSLNELNRLLPGSAADEPLPSQPGGQRYKAVRRRPVAAHRDWRHCAARGEAV